MSNDQNAETPAEREKRINSATWRFHQSCDRLAAAINPTRKRRG